VNAYSQRLQYLLDQAQIAQKDFAAGVGVSISVVSRWLNGKVASPRLKTLMKQASFFGCDLDWLAEGKGVPFPQSCHSPVLSPETSTKIEATTTDIQIKPDNHIQFMLNMARDVLESNTLYQGSLMLSIMTFHRAVQTQITLESTYRELSAMKDQVSELNDLTQSLEQVLKQKEETD